MRALHSLFVASMLAALALTTVASDRAQAYEPTNYAVVSISNRTNVTLKYEFRWSDREWKLIYVEPGHTTHHWLKYAYPDERRSPIPQVRFDADLGPGVVSTQYDLEAHACIGNTFGKPYAFEFDGYRHNFVDLRSVR
jgi:hypothetical protein